MKALLGLVFWPAAWILNGFVLTKMWTWFIVPVFGLPTLTIVTAIGIGSMVSYLTHQINYCKDKEIDEDKKFLRDLVFIIFKPLVALLFSWIISLFM